MCTYGFLADVAVSDLTSGFVHPLEGVDHLVTMLAVGIWAAQLRGNAIWLLPLTFVSVMSLGGISGAASYLTVPSTELLILLSCLVFSILIIRKIRFGMGINLLIVAFFAFFHGYAHGQEISASTSLISYTIGFVTATLILHGLGILVAKFVLIFITFFIAQSLDLTSDTTSFKFEDKMVTSFSSVITTHETITSCIQHVDLYIKNQLPRGIPWLMFSHPFEVMLEHRAKISMIAYAIFSILLLIFYIAQFFCYVFYPKQHEFKVALPHLLFYLFVSPLNAFCVSTSHFFMHTSTFIFGGEFCVLKNFNI